MHLGLGPSMLGLISLGQYMHTLRRTGWRRRKFITVSSDGFSLIELMMVVSVAFIAAGILVINVQNALRGVRLSETASSYANLLQQARIRAVRDDKYYLVLINNASSTAPFAYVDLNQNGTFDTGEPRMEFAAGVTPQSFSSGPGLANLEAQFLPAGTQGTVQTTATGPAFGPRGLPCVPGASGGYTTCPFLTPTSYITFMQNSDSGKWQAVTITPAGRVRQWSYETSSWSPLN